MLQQSLFVAVAFLFVAGGGAFIIMAIWYPGGFTHMRSEIKESEPWVRFLRRLLTIIEGMFFIAVGITLFLKVA